MGNCTLSWHSDRGFELDLDLSDGELSLRLAAVPVPADGTAELEAGVDLDRLDILFKASVEVQGDPAQLLDARVTLLQDGKERFLQVDARCEDVETGGVIPFQGRVPVSMPSGVPVAGGPRPVPANEDDLDWDDETTLEQLVVNAPEGLGRGKSNREEDDLEFPEPAPGELPSNGHNGAPEVAPRAARKPRGLQALLKALTDLDAAEDDEDDSEPDLSEFPAGDASDSPWPEGGGDPELDALAPAAVPGPAPSGPHEDGDEDEGDQSLGATGEARALLDLLVKAENLEIEDETDLDDLAAGVAQVLALPGSSERKATRLSEWLLQQDGVADLYIGDEDLAEILERW